MNKNKYSLMIVDDEEGARRHILEDIAWNTLDIGPLFQASSGREALGLLERLHPDILILDIKMPEMDGVGLLELILQSKYHPQIITLSGYSDFEAARKMLSSGIVVEYLLKPASEDELFEAVYKCIEHIDEKRRDTDVLEPEPFEEESYVSGPLPDDTSKPAKRRIVQEVKAYIQQNYAQRITLDLAARQVFLNPTYLSKIFSEVEGSGFSDYLIQVRIEQSQKLLLDVHKRIYEISEEVGYQNVKYFMKLFKRQVGMTPSEYREKQLSEF